MRDSGEMNLHPVGVVHSEIKDRKEMPMQGVTGVVEIFAEYSRALQGIALNSHLLLLCWMHEADRTILTAVARKVSCNLPEKGIFSLRSPSRPNPVSVSVVRLLEIRQDRFLILTHLDVIDRTPVLDLKPYQAGWDCVFSATNSDRTEKIKQMTPLMYKQSLIREAINYHGEMCTGLATAVRIAVAGTRLLGGDLRRPVISLTIGHNPCITDSLIGITGARSGNRRLHISEGRHYPNARDCFSLSSSEMRLDFLLHLTNSDIGEILAYDEQTLFDITLTRLS